MGCSFTLEEEEVQKIMKMCSFESWRNLDVNKNGGRRKDTPLAIQALETPATCCRFGRESWNISTRMSCGRSAIFMRQ